MENTNITVVSSTMSAAESMEQQSMKQQERATILKGANSMSKIEVSKENNGKHNANYTDYELFHL